MARRPGRETNILQLWGNKDSMNLNSMILTNIQSSTYFKTKLYDLKTYHEVIDEIYYRVTHLEPWEKGSRRTTGLTGMCGGVRGVGGGGIVSTAFCLLYKLYTLKLTRKQVVGLLTHGDSPYIRALGFMYVRFTQNPQELWDWYCDYLDDEEEIDVKAGGGCVMQIGMMLRQWLTRLEWFDTLFPRIPVPIQKEIMECLRAKYGNRVDTTAFFEGAYVNAGASSASSNSAMSGGARATNPNGAKRSPPPEIADALRGAKTSRSSRSYSGSRSRSRSRSRGRNRNKSSRSRSRSKSRTSRSRSRSRTRSRTRSRSPSRSRSKKERRDRSRSRSRSVSQERKRHRSSEERTRHRSHHSSSKKTSGDDERNSSSSSSKTTTRHRDKDAKRQTSGDNKERHHRHRHTDKQRTEDKHAKTSHSSSKHKKHHDSNDESV